MYTIHPYNQNVNTTLGVGSKIVLINGSPRKNGATSIILQYISSQLKSYSFETEIVHVSDIKLQYCMGCCKCYKIGKCIFSDDIEKLSHKIGKADGIIIGSPTYASNISGQLKTIIDRGHFVIEQLLYQKYAMSVVTYENYGGKAASKILNSLLEYSGAFVTGSLVVKNPFSHNPLKDREIQRCVSKKTMNFYGSLMKQKIPKLQSLKHFFIFQCGIIPFVRKKGEDYSGVLKAWKKNKRRF